MRVGILGGGQLGRMMLQAGMDYDAEYSVLDPTASAPCSKLCGNFVCGDLRDADTVEEFGKGLDVVTIEIEDVSVEGMRRLDEVHGVRLVPKWQHVALIQDKGLQKEFFRKHQIPTAKFCISDDPSKLCGFPVVQKLRKGGFDGRGVKILMSTDGAFDGECLLEEKVDILKEVSVIVARTPKKETISYPPAESVFDPRANIASVIVVPADIDPMIEASCRSIAMRVCEAMDFVGLLAIELFVDKDMNVLVNELAPRCHNSGHHTIEANATSQFAQLLRVVLDLPLGDVSFLRPAAATINILGDPDTPKGSPPTYRGLDSAMQQNSNVFPHIYGKSSVSPFRKMGHLTVTGHDRSSVLQAADRLKADVGCHFVPPASSS